MQNWNARLLIIGLIMATCSGCLCFKETQEKKEGARPRNDIGIQEAYEAAKGEDKKRLALELDKLWNIDYSNEFGHWYPGKKFDAELAYRKAGMSLYKSKMIFELNYVDTLPDEQRNRAENVHIRLNNRIRSIHAKLGVKNERKLVDEGWAFLNYAEKILDDKVKILLPPQLVWKLSCILLYYQNFKGVKSEKDFYHWELNPPPIWSDRDRFRTHPKEVAVLTKRWTSYMDRNYKISDYVESKLYVDIYRDRIGQLIASLHWRAENAAAHRKEKVNLKQRLKPEVLRDPKVTSREAKLHLKEAEEYVAGKSKSSVHFMEAERTGKIEIAKFACAEYVLWQAILGSKSFEEYAYLTDTLKNSRGKWPYDEAYAKRHPELVTEYKKQLAKLVATHPEFGPRKNGK